MAVRASVEQHAARPDAQKDLLAAQSATQDVTPPQHQENLVEREGAEQGKQGEQQPAGEAELVLGAAALVVGGALVVAAALFAAGFMRRPIEQALRRLVDRVGCTELPLVLPATIAETVRELRANSRIMSEMRAD